MTNLTVLYESFLAKITDYRILRMAEAEIEDTLLDYYKTASALFYKCKNDLSINETTGEIVSDLTKFEINILVSLMLIEHITPQLLSSELMKQTLSDKDFQMYSQANQLREIRLLLNDLQSKVNKRITEYTFLELGKSGN